MIRLKIQLLLQAAQVHLLRDVEAPLFYYQEKYHEEIHKLSVYQYTVDH